MRSMRLILISLNYIIRLYMWHWWCKFMLFLVSTKDFYFQSLNLFCEFPKLHFYLIILKPVPFTFLRRIYCIIFPQTRICTASGTLLFLFIPSTIPNWFNIRQFLSCNVMRNQWLCIENWNSENRQDEQILLKTFH